MFISKIKWWCIPFVAILALFIYVYFTFHDYIDIKGKSVVCIPVYGQSLALGEEAIRITDIHQLSSQSRNRIVTENMDGKFGYFDNDPIKQHIKKLLHYQKRSYELSIYSMSESLVQYLGNDTIICTFPGGQGATSIANLSKGTVPYNHFISNIRHAYHLAKKNGARSFIVPAICWMQGESDIADYPGTNYKQLLLDFIHDINKDIKDITHQSEDVRIICYQPNALSIARFFNGDNYICPEVEVPQAFVDLLREDTLFWASGPTYPYSVVREVVHIDGIGQKRIGYLASLSALSILRHGPRFVGLIPLSCHASDSTVTIHFSVPVPPLVIDTIQVRKATHSGFQVINKECKDIAKAIHVDNTSITIDCYSSPKGCKVRYAVNGDYMKSGNIHGPRGNIRDSQGDKLKTVIKGKEYGLSNWAYQFEMFIGQ